MKKVAAASTLLSPWWDKVEYPLPRASVDIALSNDGRRLVPKATGS